MFRYDSKIYIFDTKLAQSAVNKLEKGAEEYLKNSPLKDTFLKSSSKSPEIRRAIAALFRKSTLEEKGELIIKDVMNMCDKIEEEANEGKIDAPSSSQLLAIYRYAYKLSDRSNIYT